MQNPDQPPDGWSLQLQNDSCFIFFQTSTNSTLKREKKYTHMTVNVVSTSSTPQARDNCVWAEDSKAFHQIPLSVQKVAVEGCQGELQPAANTGLLRDGNSGDQSSSSRQVIIRHCHHHFPGIYILEWFNRLSLSNFLPQPQVFVTEKYVLLTQSLSGQNSLSQTQMYFQKKLQVQK